MLGGTSKTRNLSPPNWIQVVNNEILQKKFFCSNAMNFMFLVALHNKSKVPHRYSLLIIAPRWWWSPAGGSWGPSGTGTHFRGTSRVGARPAGTWTGLQGSSARAGSWAHPATEVQCCIVLQQKCNAVLCCNKSAMLYSAATKVQYDAATQWTVMCLFSFILDKINIIYMLSSFNFLHEKLISEVQFRYYFFVQKF